jgi:hypothetical protein
MGGVIVDAYGERKAKAVMRETWGHLDAEEGVIYPGTITFMEGCYGGERMILSAEFGDAGYGPWFYYGIHDWLSEQDTEPSTVYLFTGTYQLVDEAHHFVGTTTKLT